MAVNVLIVWLTFAAGSAAGLDANQTAPITPNQVRAAIEKGVDFLLKDQNSDGSWGGPQDSITTWSGS